MNWLREQKWGDQEFLRLAILSRALRSQGETNVATINWNRAVREFIREIRAHFHPVEIRLVVKLLSPYRHLYPPHSTSVWSWSGLP